MRLMAFFTLLFSVASFAVSAQKEKEYPVPYNKDKDKIIYEEVVSEKGVDKKTLFERFNNWGEKFYRNYSGKVEKKKKDANPPVVKLDGWAELKYPNYESERINYELTIQFKDGRYKYSFHKLHIDRGYFFGLEKWIEPKQIPKEKAQEKLKTLDKKMNSVIKEMKDYISNPPKEKDDSW